MKTLASICNMKSVDLDSVMFITNFYLENHYNPMFEHLSRKKFMINFNITKIDFLEERKQGIRNETRI